MSIDALFARTLAIGAVDGLREYYEAMEKELQSLKGRKCEEIYQQIKNLKLSSEEESSELDIAMQEHRATYDMLFANYLRYSCITLLLLVLEYQLHEICRAIQEVKSITTPVKKPDKCILKGYRKCLEDEAGITVKWDRVFDLNKIRNCIVHASGNVNLSKSKYKPHLISVAQREKGLSISGINNNYNTQTQPLYLEDGMLVLEPEFCTNAILEVRKLIDEICKATSLPSPLAQNN